MSSKVHIGNYFLSEDLKGVLDTVSWGALIGSMIDVLPHAATALTVVWMSIRIWESDTIQKALGREPTSKNDE